MTNNDQLIELLVKLLENDVDNFFELLIELTNPLTYATLKKYYFPGYEKKDFVQEAQKVLYKAIKTFDEDYEVKFLQYYHMSLSNHMNKLVRKKRAQKRRVNLKSISLDKIVEEIGISVQGTSPAETKPEDMAMVNETLQSYLVELSLFEEKVLNLFVSGISPKDIAEQLSCEIRQVQSGLYRCKKKLEKLIEQ